MGTIVSLFRKNLIRREVKKMKKLIVSLIAVSMVLSIPCSAFAFTQDGIQPYNATVTPATGTGQIVTVFSASLRRIDNDNVASSVTWSSVTAQATDWKSANQYIRVGGFETYATWGIQVYTDNVNSTPAYSGSGDPAGLVNNTDRSKTLPMCWRVSADKKLASSSDDLKITQKYIATTDGYVLLRVAGDYVSDTAYFAPWFWMLDKSTPDVDSATAGNQPFGNYQLYATLVGNYGVSIAPSTYGAVPSKDSQYYVYMGAKFISAQGSIIYSTTKLTVEMYHL
ncbi:MAG: hypothetical protein JW946_01745 [Candidatus Omnitrophica bacterium]|nr:hypothetical protein [Candidatus Omnitrophota bacterium]